MRRHPRAWQQVLGAIALLLSPCPGLRAAPQSFAVALPELEGPVTMGIFDGDGRRVRMLCRDADIDSIPAGLNGLIMTWDGKDDAGADVLPGSYRARGLVHGPITVSAVPVVIQRGFSLGETGLPWEREAFPANAIVERAPQDELQETRPLLRIAAVRDSDGGRVLLEADGLPLRALSADVVIGPGEKLTLRHGDREGLALLDLAGDRETRSLAIGGLDRIVPLDAGALEVTADASHPAVNAGESRP